MVLPSACSGQGSKMLFFICSVEINLVKITAAANISKAEDMSNTAMVNEMAHIYG